MPQMNPTQWELALPFFSMTLMLLTVKNYFNKNNELSVSNKESFLYNQSFKIMW